MKINKISPQKQNFLKVLSNIDNPPEKLHYIGNIPSERIPTVAIVGSRKVTSYGREVTHKLSYDLASRGVVIVSGLALGVDSIAHNAALEANGTTLAILANGLNSIYPATNRQLAEKIVRSNGAILSEYEPEDSAMKYRFIERNRLVSGLSDAIIVTEAAIHSGTFSTVAFALNQGKEVFAVPGNITSPLSQGCNILIKQGAHSATQFEDILEIIAPNLLNSQSILPLGSNQTESKIIELIQSGIRDGDEIQSKLNIDVSEFSTTLTMMEINGQIRSLGANQWTLK